MKKGTHLSRSTYNHIIGMLLIYGIVLNMFMCWNFTDVFLQMNLYVVGIGYFVLASVGILMSVWSDNPFISFIGYNLVVAPIGVILSILVSDMPHESIMNVCLITGCVTACMTMLSSAIPNIFLSIGKVLGVCLSIVIFIELIMIFVGKIHSNWWDLLVALLFCLYIGYDWAAAQEDEPTLDNAVDAAVGLYLDIINLFIRLLASSSNKG